MKTRTVKTKIKQLVTRLGSYDAVGLRLEITGRYVRMMEKGKPPDGKIPGKFLYPRICTLYDEVFGK